jgi:prepilin-type N-terminal cleavage/methylation domain-containing protein
METTNTHKKHGFTLIEIVMALGMLSLIMTALYGSYQAVTGSIDRMSPRFRLERRAVFVLNAMCRELRSSYAGRLDRAIPRDSEKVLRKLKDDQERPSAFAGKSGKSSAKLRFFTAQSPSRNSERHGELSQVIYTWDRSDGQLLMARCPNIYQDIEDEKDLTWRCLLDSVLDLQLEFSDGEDWGSVWPESTSTSAILPRSVRLHLVVGPDDLDCVDLTSTISIVCRGETFETTPRDQPVKTPGVNNPTRERRL